MKVTTVLATLLSMVAAAPMAQAPPPSMGTSIQGMTSGAGNFAGDFLKGDMGAVGKDLTDMVGGAASFPAGFFNDAAKNGALPSSNPGPAAHPAQ